MLCSSRLSLWIAIPGTEHASAYVPLPHWPGKRQDAAWRTYTAATSTATALLKGFLYTIIEPIQADLPAAWTRSVQGIQYGWCRRGRGLGYKPTIRWRG